jgi:hypothetical protein
MVRHIALIACLGLAGCSPPVIDASSPDALKASMSRVTSGMGEARRRVFAADCTTLTLGAALKGGLLAKGAKPSGTGMFKPLHGLTADRVHARAEEFRASLNR